MRTFILGLLSSTMLLAIEPGAAAPGFTLASATGASVSLSDFAGKTVVLEWVNYDCPFVKKHYSGSGNMPKLQAEWRAKGIIWLSVCSSTTGKQGHLSGQALLDRIAAEKAAPTAYLIDANGTVGKAYEAKSTPTMAIIKPDGTIAYFGAIDSKRSANPADIADATNYVNAALTSLLAGEAIAVPRTNAYGCGISDPRITHAFH